MESEKVGLYLSRKLKPDKKLRVIFSSEINSNNKNVTIVMRSARTIEDRSKSGLCADRLKIHPSHRERSLGGMA